MPSSPKDLTRSEEQKDAIEQMGGVHTSVALIAAYMNIILENAIRVDNNERNITYKNTMVQMLAAKAVEEVELIREFYMFAIEDAL